MRNVKNIKKMSVIFFIFVIFICIGIYSYETYKWNEKKVFSDVDTYCSEHNSDLNKKNRCYCRIFALKRIIPKKKYHKLIDFIRDNEVGDVNYFAENVMPKSSNSMSESFIIYYESFSNCMDYCKGKLFCSYY